MSNHAVTELFDSHIRNMNRGSLHTRSFRRVHFSVELRRGPKSFRGFRETDGSEAGRDLVLTQTSL